MRAGDSWTSLPFSQSSIVKTLTSSKILSKWNKLFLYNMMWGTTGVTLWAMCNKDRSSSSLKLLPDFRTISSPLLNALVHSCLSCRQLNHGFIQFVIIFSGEPYSKFWDPIQDNSVCTTVWQKSKFYFYSYYSLFIAWFRTYWQARTVIIQLMMVQISWRKYLFIENHSIKHYKILSDHTP